MAFRVYLMVMCLGVVSDRLAMALEGFEMKPIITKMDFAEGKSQEVEQTVKTDCEIENLLKKMEIRLQEKFETRMNLLEMAMRETEQASKDRHTSINEMLIRLEKVGMERIGEVDSKFNARIQAMENSLQESMKTGEDNTREKIEDLKNQLISKMDSIHPQQMAETLQETTQTALLQLGENEKTLDILTDSVRNMNNLSEKSKKILEAQFPYPVQSCRQVMKLSGRHVIDVGQNLQPFEVLCEQTKFEGGWTVIQQRFDGSVDFYRNWTDYRNGFGNVDGEFLLGLEYVHQMTKNRPHELLVEVKDFHGNYGYAKYDEFEVGSEWEEYELKKLGTYSGTAGNPMQYQQNQKFTTFDRDNDKSDDVNCAEEHHGAWWYWGCSYSNLNGRYENTTNDSAMTWYYLKNDFRGMSYSRMMIRDIIN